MNVVEHGNGKVPWMSTLALHSNVLTAEQELLISMYYSGIGLVKSTCGHHTSISRKRSDALVSPQDRPNMKW